MEPLDTNSPNDEREKMSGRETHHKKLRRSYVACERCHRNKTKCNGQNPCRNCQQSRKPIECVYPVRDRKITVAESYIKTLEAENKALKRKRSPERRNQNSDVGFIGANENVNSNVPSRQTSQGPSLPQSPNHTAPGRQPHRITSNLQHQSIIDAQDGSTSARSNFVADDTSIQPRYSGEASSETFGVRLNQYINHGERRPPPRPYAYYKNPKLLRISSTDCDLPNKNYAKLLVRAVLRFVGGDHHLLLRRSFLKRLDETYELEVLDDPVWLCRLFTVLALGELYSHGRAGSAQEEGGVPGTGFFIRAMGYFQDMHEEPTVGYIESLLLLSFYCVALNRRITAYTYAGLALRLGLTLGLHRKVQEDSGMSAAEREHRVRVWWTAYALDRIYTSKVGLPVMLRDEDIDVQMPSMDGLTPEEAEDFYPPELMTAQIKLARITGNVMSDLYRIPQPGRANTFVQSVQRILTSLRSWHETLPSVLRLDFNAMPIYPSRSVASLHLHFGNTVIQTTRPILFHIFRSHFAHNPAAGSRKPTSPVTSALAESCVQAARTSNSILAQLWVDGCLAPFGYFDSLSVFASTMILMMSSTMKEGGSSEDDAVETAWSLLRSMRESGNLPASGCYDQLVELKTSLDSLVAKSHPQKVRSASDLSSASNGGLRVLLAASDAVNSGPTISNAQALPVSDQPPIHHTSYLRNNRAGEGFTAFGVGVSMGALDDPFLQDFLQEPYGGWAGSGAGVSLDPLTGLPMAGQEAGGAGNGGFTFEWENANLFGGM